MYEMEGPRRGHLAGHRLLGYRGAIRPLHRGGKISPEGQFPGFPFTPPRLSGFPVRRSAGVELISILGGAEFLPLTPGPRKGFLPRSY